MGFFSAGKKAARFTFIAMPMAVLGISQLKMGNQQIRDLWRSNFSPVCPECNEGVLTLEEQGQQQIEQDAQGRRRILHPWVCSHCQFAMLQEANARIVKAAATRYRNERVKASLSTLERQQIERIARNHALHARAFFISSALAFCGFIYLLAQGSAVLIALNWLSICFALWVFGMKKSYRHWQITSGQLFVKGAFWFWFQTQKWLV